MITPASELIAFYEVAPLEQHYVYQHLVERRLLFPNDRLEEAPASTENMVDLSIFIRSRVTATLPYRLSNLRCRDDPLDRPRPYRRGGLDRPGHPGG